MAPIGGITLEESVKALQDVFVDHDLAKKEEPMSLIDAVEQVKRLVNKKLEEKEERSISSYTDGWCEGAKFVLSEIEHTASIRLCQNCKHASRIKKTRDIYCDRYEKVKSKNGYCDLAERRTDATD